MVWLGVAVGIVVGFDLWLRYLTVSDIRGILEKVPPFSIVPDPPDDRAVEVSIPTSNDLTLRGSLFLPPAPRGLIVFCHELYGNRWMAMRYCRALYDAGFAILAFDFRNEGDSDALADYEPIHWATQYEVDDVLATIRFAQQDERLRGLPLGIVGISRGGAAGLAAAAVTPFVRAIVADSAFSLRTMVNMYVRQWGEIYVPRWLIQWSPGWYLRSVVRTARRISQWRRNCRYVRLEPLLPRLADRGVMMICGQRDSYVKPAIASELGARVGSECEVWIVSKAKHNKAREVAPEEYDGRLIRFFEQHLQSPAREPETAPSR